MSNLNFTFCSGIVPTLENRTSLCLKPKNSTSNKNRFKIVLLGTGGSGKTTFEKLILNHFGDKQCVDFPIIVHAMKENIFCDIISIITMLREEKEEELNKDKELKECIDTLLLWDKHSIKRLPEQVTNIENKNIILKVVKHPIFQNVLNHRNEYPMIQIMEHCKYFIGKIEELMEWNNTLKLSFNDYVLFQIKTIGIVDNVFEYENKSINLVDTGGQRNERKKWQYPLEDSDAIVFLISLSEINELCYEDGLTNRSIESLNTFEHFIQKKEMDIFFPKYVNSSCFIIFTKYDLLKERLSKGQINVKAVFDDYGGDEKDPKAIVQYLETKYVQIASKYNRKIAKMFHIDVTDSEQVTSAFKDILKSL
ncbi:hypothetical protein ABK040_005887 [Willaertia magna]